MPIYTAVVVHYKKSRW